MTHGAGWRCLEFGGHTLALEWADARAGEWVELLTGAHPSVAPTLPSAVFRLHSGDEGPRLTVFADTACIYRGDAPAAGLHALMEAMMQHWVRACGAGLMLHAGLVSRQACGVLVAGASGAGKSSLIAWLVQQGWSYHSDELVFARADGECWQGFARPLCLKGDWHALFPARASAVTTLPATAERTMVPVAAFSTAPSPATVSPGCMLFPCFEAGATKTLTRMSAGKTAIRLVEAVLNGGNLSQHGIAIIGAMARGVPAFALRYGNFDQLDTLDEQLLQASGVCTQ